LYYIHSYLLHSEQCYGLAGLNKDSAELVVLAIVCAAACAVLSYYHQTKLAIAAGIAGSVFLLFTFYTCKQ